MDLAEWIDSYRRAWEGADEDLAVSLFTTDATYQSTPFQEPLRGRDEIRDYWREGTEGKGETRVRMGRPYVDEARVAVEWWATMIDDGEEVTLPGCLLLSFEPDGLCSSLREYWILQPGRSEPFPGWGD